MICKGMKNLPVIYKVKDSKKENYFSSSVAEFPAITICPDFNIGFRTDFLKAYGTTANEVRKLNVPDLINMTFAEFYNLATLDLQVS